MPYIFHITGSPGCGKSTLLRNLRPELNASWLLKDLDSFSNVLFDSTEWANTNSDDGRGKLYVRYMTDAVTEFVRKNSDKNIVFAGVGTTYSSASLTTECKDKCYGMQFKLPKSHKFVGIFLNVLIGTIIKQQFERDVKQRLKTGFKNLMKEKGFIYFNPSYALMIHKCDLAYWKGQKYKLATPKATQLLITKLAQKLP